MPAISMSSFLYFVHLIGLALAVGAATVKVVLLLKSKADPAFARVFLLVAKPITRLIVLGLALLALSGIAWLALGYEFTPRLVVKLVLVATIMVLGPVIDNVVEPKLARLVAASGGASSTELVRVQRQYLVLEITATGLFYAVIVLWVLLR